MKRIICLPGSVWARFLYTYLGPFLCLSCAHTPPGDAPQGTAGAQDSPSDTAASQAGKSATSVETKTIALFAGALDEGDYLYAFPEGNAEANLDRSNAQPGAVTLRVALDSRTHSGAAIGFGTAVDAQGLRERGTLQFWARGSGGAKFEIALVDGSENNSQKVENRISLKKYGNLSESWQFFRVPLSAFRDQGVVWNGTELESKPFEWHDIKEFKILSQPSGDGKSGGTTLHFADIALTDSPPPALERTN